MRFLLLVIFAATLILGAGVIRDVWSTLAPDETRPVPRDRALAARGRPLYRQHCADCHGPKLGGERQAPGGARPAPPHDAAGSTYEKPDAGLLALIRDGKGRMPAFGDTLDARQRRAVLAFIKRHWTSAQYQQQFVLSRAEWQERLDGTGADGGRP